MPILPNIVAVSDTLAETDPEALSDINEDYMNVVKPSMKARNRISSTHVTCLSHVDQKVASST